MKTGYVLGATLLLLLFAVFIGATQEIFRRATGRDLASVLTTPIGASLGEAAVAKADDAAGVAISHVTITPMTGGGATAGTAAREPGASGPHESAEPAATNAPNGQDKLASNSSSGHAPEPIEQEQASSQVVTLESAAPRKTLTDLIEQASNQSSPASEDPSTARKPVAAASNDTMIHAAFGMQDGAVVTGGQQAPGLRIVLEPAQIDALLKAGKAVAIAFDESENEASYLDSPGGEFRPIANLDSTRMSERYLPITDAGVIAAWSVRIGAPPDRRFTFGLRFTQTFNQDILTRQMNGLAGHQINFDQAVADHRRIETEGHFGQDLGFVVDQILVDPLS
jgi:hypothetical protein